MITQLTISNYALIDNLTIDFSKGFSAITGETGAGKSIILGALSLILGGRADMKGVRKEGLKSIIEAEFSLKDYDLVGFFEKNDLLYDEDLTILRRELLPNGRSRAFVNDSPVTLSLLQDLSVRLIDIHSQNSNQLIAKAEYQLSVIDSIAKNGSLLDEYSKIFAEYSKSNHELNQLLTKSKSDSENLEYMKFQLSQLSVATLSDIDEESELEAAQLLLSNVADIKSKLWSAEQDINDSEESVLMRLRRVSHEISTLNNISPIYSELYERIDSVLIELKDIYATTQSLQSELEDNPQELERVNERLSLIFDLKRKFNVESIAELLNIQNSLEASIADIDNYDWKINELQKRVDQCYAKLIAKGSEITATRKIGAKDFVAALMEMSKPLKLNNLQCEFKFQQVTPNAIGVDAVELLVAFNKNQSLTSIAETASGGEISRLMLIVKSVIAESLQLPSIIFDEVDSGVSGDVASRMGMLMKQISNHIQVIAITHLPQVAALGDYQYKVFKVDNDMGTSTFIDKLSNDKRIEEIASMLSGDEITLAAMDNAKALLKF
ncbi:MAG: DNA repair protein RecN [Bacteroidales bacterium]